MEAKYRASLTGNAVQEKPFLDTCEILFIIRYDITYWFKRAERDYNLGEELLAPAARTTLSSCARHPEQGYLGKRRHCLD